MKITERQIEDFRLKAGNILPWEAGYSLDAICDLAILKLKDQKIEEDSKCRH